MARILAIVLNNVSNDARVLRAAECLREDGHEVIVLGLHDTPDDPAEEDLNGVRVRRIGGGKNRRPAWLHRRKNRGPAWLHRSKSFKTLPTHSIPTPAPAHGRGFEHAPEWLFTLRRSNRPIKMLKASRRRARRDRALYDEAVALRPALIHAHDVDTLPASCAAAAKLNVPMIFDAHEVYDQRHVVKRTQEATRRLNSYLLARHAGKIDGFVTLTEAIAHYYKSTYPNLPDPTVVANAAAWLNNVEDDGRLHVAAGWSREVRILLYQGIYSELRCLAELLDAAEYMSDDWGIVTLGYGRLKEAMLERASRLSPTARARVRILDAVPQAELPRWTAGATLGYLALPRTHLSYWLASPNRLWAYPQVGVPIIGTSFPELERIATTYGAAFVLGDHVTAESIAAFVNNVGREQLQQARTGCEAFMRAESWEAHAARLQALVRRLVTDGGGAVGSNDANRVAESS
jgi:hypothetical protein